MWIAAEVLDMRGARLRVRGAARRLRGTPSNQSAAGIPIRAATIDTRGALVFIPAEVTGIADAVGEIPAAPTRVRRPTTPTTAAALRLSPAESPIEALDFLGLRKTVSSPSLLARR